MKSRILLTIAAITAIATAIVRAQPAPHHHHYKLLVLGPLGGPTSGTGGNNIGHGTLNNVGATIVAGDTPVADPFNVPFNIFHPYLWQNGSQVDFQVLPIQPYSAGNNAYPNWVNQFGFTAGWSATGVIDPITGAPQAHAVLWTPNGRIFDLGTLGGYQSMANALNDFGQVTGWVENTTPDPFSFGEGTESQAFVWQLGVMRPLGTLGGPDSMGLYINDLGQVAGCSLTSAAPNASTGFPTFDSFIWQNGKMTDLNPGNFGGTQSCPNYMNELGQIVGFMTDAQENSHPFFWQNGKTTDLFTAGNLGGDTGSGKAVNSLGHVAGDAFTAGAVFVQAFRHAVLWRNGGIVDLQMVNGGPCSDAYFLNSHDQVVGTSGACDESSGDAFLWENGSIVDLNSLIPANSGIQLQFAEWINENGEIAGNGTLTDNGYFRAFLLIPCDENHPNIAGCDYSLVESMAAANIQRAQTTQEATVLTGQKKLSQAEISAKYRQIIRNPRRRSAGQQSTIQ